MANASSFVNEVKVSESNAYPDGSIVISDVRSVSNSNAPDQQDEIGINSGQTLSIQIIPAPNGQQAVSGSTFSSSSDVVCVGGVEELQRFLNSFNSELAATNELATSQNASISNSISISDSSFATSSTLIYSGDQISATFVPGQQEFVPPTVTLCMRDVKIENTVIPSEQCHIDQTNFASTSMAVTNLPNQNIQQHPTSSHQILIPVDCAGGLNANQVTPGSTLLLPIVPTVLPDGSIEVRITGQAIALPSTVRISPNTVPHAPPEPPIAPEWTQQQQQQEQQQILVIVGESGGTGDGSTVPCEESVAPTEPTEDTWEKPKPEKKSNRSKKAQIKPRKPRKERILKCPRTGLTSTDFQAYIPTESTEEGEKNENDEKKDKKEASVIEKVAEVAKGNKQVYQCEFCDYSNVKKYLMTRHMRSHSEDRPHVCHVCEKRFKTTNSLQNHVNTHTGTRPHQCRQCPSTFTTSGEMIRHVRYKHTQEKPHKCSSCDYASVELSKLRRHMRSHTGEKPYKCRRCPYSSPDMYKLKRHMRTHTGEKPYECDICLQRFTQSNSLKAHKILHTDHKPSFQCEFCSTCCGRKTDLRIHIRKLHTKLDRPVKCKKCAKEFTDRYSLRQHQRTHDGERNFACNFCNYAAFSQRHLKTHLMIHQSEKPHECPISECVQAFRQKGQLNRHVKTIHGVTMGQLMHDNTKKFECGKCQKKYGKESDLREHEKRRHSGIEIEEENGMRSEIGNVLDESESEQEMDVDADGNEDEEEESHSKAQAHWRGNTARYTCSSCGECFRQLVQLEHHCQLEHIGMVMDVPFESN